MMQLFVPGKDGMKYAKEQGYTEKDLTDRICNRCGKYVFTERQIQCRSEYDENGLCDGTGIVTKDGYSEVGGEMKKGETCPDCNGTGKYYPYYCVECDENMFNIEVKTSEEIIKEVGKKQWKKIVKGLENEK